MLTLQLPAGSCGRGGTCAGAAPRASGFCSMGSSCLLLSEAGVLRVAQGVPQAWLGVTWGDAHRLRPTPPTAAVTPRALQVKVKRHVQLILERLLHTVNRRVIVLERDNSLRVSYHRLRRARDRSASPGDEEVREGLHDVGMGSRWQTFLGGAVASDSSCWGWVCGYLTQQDARGSPKKEGGNAAEAGRGVGGVLGGARRVFVMQEARLEPRGFGLYSLENGVWTLRTFLILHMGGVCWDAHLVLSCWQAAARLRLCAEQLHRVQWFHHAGGGNVLCASVANQAVWSRPGTWLWVVWGKGMGLVAFGVQCRGERPCCVIPCCPILCHAVPCHAVP